MGSLLCLITKQVLIRSHNDIHRLLTPQYDKRLQEYKTIVQITTIIHEDHSKTKNKLLISRKLWMDS